MKENASEWEMIYSPEACETFNLFTFIKLQKAKPLLKDVHALKNVTFHINEGERVGVIGRNGSGKSTLLRTIAGIYPIESGKIEVKGKIHSLFDIVGN